MSAETPMLIRRFAVGPNYVVTLTVPKPVPGRPTMCCAEWSPHKPDGLLEGQERHDWTTNFQAVIAEISRATGLPQLVLELP
jgi:hypothetical protein